MSGPVLSQVTADRCECPKLVVELRYMHRHVTAQQIDESDMEAIGRLHEQTVLAVPSLGIGYPSAGRGEPNSDPFALARVRHRSR
jgi:hypothetical protein